MKKFTKLLALLALCAAPLFAQTSLTGTNCTNPITTDDKATVLVTITGSWSGAIQLSGIDSVGNVLSVGVAPTTTGVVQATITANGAFIASASGFTQFKACGATITNTAVVLLTASSKTASNRGGASGGGNGATSVGLALPVSLFTVSGTPVTTTGTLTGSFASIAAHTVVGNNTSSPATAAVVQLGFSDLTGSVTAAQLPNPAAGALGGTQSKAVVASNFLTGISIAGVVSAAQPAFSDISGTASAAQIAAMTSAQLAGIISDEIGSGKAVFATALQGTDANVLTSGTVSGTSAPLCTDGNAGATTVGCPSSGTVTVVGAGSLTSTALTTGGGTITLQTPSATTTLDSSGNLATVGTITNSKAGAASVTPFTLTGAVLTGGTGTTNFPHMNFDMDATKPTTWSTSGTLIGVNALTAFAGNFLDFHVHGGASLFSITSSGSVVTNSSVSASGNVTAGATAGLTFSGRSGIFSNADGSIELLNNAATGFTALLFGGTTANQVSLSPNGTILTTKLANGSAGGFFLNGATKRVASNFATSGVGTALETITGLSWTVPATGTVVFSFNCDLSYSQATGATVVAFGIEAATAAPTNIYATGIQQITVGPPATLVTGTLATLASTTATNIVSGTPGATATNYTVHLAGTIENAATTANTFNIKVSTATAANLVTVLRGSQCAVY